MPQGSSRASSCPSGWTRTAGSSTKRRSASSSNTCKDWASDRSGRRVRRVLHGLRDHDHPDRRAVLPAEVVDHLPVEAPLPTRATLTLLVGRVTTIKLAYWASLTAVEVLMPIALN